MMSGITSGTPAATREPLGGYNHNIRYHERIYHVQTEDSGLARPHILTHLFLDGMIVASLRTDYSELIAAPDNEAVVREIMQEQHKQIMKMLRRGELDERIDELQASAQEAPESELPPEFAPAPPSSPRVVTVPDTTTEQRGCVTLVDFPPVLDAQLKAAIAKQQQQHQQQQQQAEEPSPQPQPSSPAAIAEPAAPPPANASQQIPAGIDLPDSPPESIELEPLAEAAQMIDPAQVVGAVQMVDPDQTTAPAAEAIVLTPPPERVVNRQEARSIRRGQAISREIRIPTEFREKHATPEVGQRIDLDHPAFSAFPMLEWDGSDDDAVDLDLAAINNLDLDAEPRRLDSQQLQAIELELEMPPEPLPAPRSPSEREAAGAALSGDPMAAMSLAAEPRRSSSPSWGEELELDEPDDFEMMVTPSGPIPIPRLPTPHSPGEQLSPLPALNEERQGRKPSLPPVQASQRPLEVKPIAPPPVKRAAAPAPELFDDPPAPPAGASTTPPPSSPPKAKPAPLAAAPRLMKRPSLPVIPLNKLVEIEPEVMGKQRSDPTVGDKPSTLDKGSKPGGGESDDDA